MSLDDRQEIVLRTFTRKQLENMDIDDIVRLVGEAGPGAKLRGKGLVKRADGSIRYAPEAVPGEFNETPEELAAHAARELVTIGDDDYSTASPPASTEKVS